MEAVLEEGNGGGCSEEYKYATLPSLDWRVQMGKP